MINWSNTVAGQASLGHRGHEVEMKTSNELHYSNWVEPRRAGDDVSGSFADMLRSAVGNVNNLQIESENAIQQMIHNPESVDIHSVMIAGQKAEIALSFTKSIRDEAIRSFRELMNMR